MSTLALVEKITGPLVKSKKLNGANHANSSRGTNFATSVIVGKRPYRADMTDQQILDEYAFPSANGARLKKLLDGDTSDYPSPSEADLACASDLGFWFWNDPVAVEHVMRNSKLARPKWDEHKDYLVGRTIGKALSGKTDYYGKDIERPSSPETPKEPAPGVLRKSIRSELDTPRGKTFNYHDHMQPVQDLLDNPPPPIEYVVPDLWARGASILFVGKPKSFKSWLATQIALALCSNKHLMGDWALFGKITGTYRVCIIDYEQSEQIAAKLIERFGVKKVKGLLRINEFPKLDEAGLGELRKLIVEQKLDVVIIDSWTRAAPALGKGEGAFVGEGKIMNRVTKLAHETGCLIVVIAHGGKRDAADDPMQMIAGTNALPASVDDVIVLYKHKDDGDDGSTVRRRLFVTGRNIAKHGTYVLEKRDVEACFVLMGSEDVYVRGEVRRKIMGLLGGGAAMKPNELAISLGRDRSQVHRALASLVAEKLVMSVGEGKYMTRTAKAIANLKKVEKGQ